MQETSPYETLTDDALVALAQQDVEAFAALYRRHVQRVYSYLLSRVGHVHDAQDLTTQTFIAALHSLETYQPRGLFVAWLLAIAKRKISDHFRAMDATVSLDQIMPISANGEALEETVTQRLRMAEITAILAKLNPERAEAIRLRYLANLKIRAVAEVMGKSEGAIKMLVARGLEDIRQVLGIREDIS